MMNSQPVAETPCTKQPGPETRPLQLMGVDLNIHQLKGGYPSFCLLLSGIKGLLRDSLLMLAGSHRCNGSAYCLLPHRHFPQLIPHGFQSIELLSAGCQGFLESSFGFLPTIKRFGITYGCLHFGHDAWFAFTNQFAGGRISFRLPIGEYLPRLSKICRQPYGPGPTKKIWKR